MPTYRNDTDRTILMIPPGGTYATEEYLDIPGLTEIDYLPYKNLFLADPLIEVTIDNTVHQVDLHEKCNKVIIKDATVPVEIVANVFNLSGGNQSLTVNPGDIVELTFDRRYYRRLYVYFSTAGSVKIYQLEREVLNA